MNIIQLKEEIDKFFSSVSIDDYYNDNNLLSLKDYALQLLAPGIPSIEDQFLIDYFKTEFEKALEQNDDELLKTINELSTLLLKGYIRKVDEVVTTWGEPYIDGRDREVQDPIHTPTGKYSIEFNSSANSHGEFHKIVKAKLSPVNVIPENWKSILQRLLSHPYKQFSGSYYENESYGEYSNPNWSKRHNEGIITEQDLITLLTTKLAIVKNESLISSNNEIILGLTGGFASRIQIRETSVNTKQSQDKSLKVYHLSGYGDRFEKFTILYQEGYTNSEIKSLFSRGFYFVSPEYIVEISYFPSSILIGDNQFFKSIEDHPSLNLIEDEEEEARRLDDD